MELTNNIEMLKSMYLKDYKPNKREYPFIINLLRIVFPIFARFFPKAASRFAYKIFTTPRSRAKHKNSDKILEQAKIFDFLYGSHMLKGYEWGSGDKTVLLVHGWESRGTALRSFVPKLVEKGFKVVAFDGPAHGNSSGKRTDLPSFGGAIRAIINHTGNVHGIIAHSFGGVSTVFTLANLETELKIEKLVLIGVPSSAKKVIKSFTKMINAPEAIFKNILQFIEQKFSLSMDDADIRKVANRINVKEAMIVHDESDQIVPISEGKLIACAWPNATFLITNGYGHFKLMKNPDLVDRVTAFL